MLVELRTWANNCDQVIYEFFQKVNNLFSYDIRTKNNKVCEKNESGMKKFNKGLLESSEKS